MYFKVDIVVDVQHLNDIETQNCMQLFCTALFGVMIIQSLQQDLNNFD